MEMELSGLIDKIKKEGIEKAESEASGIIGKAKEEARGIIEAAEKRKETLVKEAGTQADRFRELSGKALNQSARDVLLSLKDTVARFAGTLIKEEVSKALTSEAVKDVILEAVGNFSRGGDFGIEVLVNERDRLKLEKAIFNEVSGEIRNRMMVKGSKGVKKGFRIGEEGKESYFDFTDEAIAEAFMQYLNPKLAEMLDKNILFKGDAGAE